MERTNASAKESIADNLIALAEPSARKLQLEKSPVIKALRLLTLLAQSGEPLPLSELSRSLGLPKPTGHRLAQLLEEAGFVHKDPLTFRYSIGQGFDALALGALRNGMGSNARRLLMDNLSARLGVRTNFTVLKSGKLMLVEWVETSSSLIRIDLKPGTQVPAHCSASGKLLIAFASEELRERFLVGAPFQAFTKATITEAKALKRELNLIRSRGYAEDNQEFLPGVCCLAVPVRDNMGDVVAGLAVMAPVMSFPLAEARRHLPEIQACAEAIAAHATRDTTRLPNAPTGEPTATSEFSKSDKPRKPKAGYGARSYRRSQTRLEKRRGE